MECVDGIDDVSVKIGLGLLRLPTVDPLADVSDKCGWMGRGIHEGSGVLLLNRQCLFLHLGNL